MGFYQTNEAGFDVPAGWVDASVNRLEYDRPGGPLRIGITRAPREGKDLTTLVGERLVEQRRGLHSFELLGRADRLVGGVPAVDLQVKHADATGRAYHRTLAIAVREKLVLVVVSGLEAHRAELDALFERVASTLEVRAPLPQG